MNSKEFSSEFITFLNEFKYTSVLNECFGISSKLYTVEY